MFSFRSSIRNFHEGVARLRRTTGTSLGRAQEMLQDNQRHTSVVPRRMFNNYNPCGKIRVFLRERRGAEVSKQIIKWSRLSLKPYQRML